MMDHHSKSQRNLKRSGRAPLVPARARGPSAEQSDGLDEYAPCRRGDSWGAQTGRFCGLTKVHLIEVVPLVTLVGWGRIGLE